MKIKLLGFLLTLLIYSIEMQAQYQIIAHRGASFKAPENTIAAVELAWKLGADAVEVDIHLSKDGFIMVNHDKDTQRTAGEPWIIKDTEANKLRKLDVGSFKDPQYKGEKMPFLEEVIATVPEGKKLFIEVKSGVEVLPVLKDIIRKGGKENQMVIISFDKDVMIEGKKLMPETPFYWLLGSFEEYSLVEALNIAKENKLDGLDVNYKLVTSAFMQQMEKEGLAVYTYTVNDASLAEELVNLQVDGITTDRPGWLKEQL